ncbi:MAG: ABC transporter permease subunit [Acidimicrobiales bacterium]
MPRPRRAIQAEWTKLWTVPSTPWLLATAVALTVAGSTGALAAVDTSQCPTPSECFEDTTKLSLSGIWLGQAAIVVLAVQAMSSEYGTRTIGSTLAANPSRRLVLLAKATAVATTALVTGVLGVLGSLAAGRAILPGNGFTRANGYQPLSLADGPTLRAAVGTVLYLALVALLSLGVATVVRDTVGAITGALTLLYAFPLVAQIVSDPRWQQRLERYGPTEAGLSIQHTTRLDELPIGPWPGLGVLATYAGVALLSGMTLFQLRDA